MGVPDEIFAFGRLPFGAPWAIVLTTYMHMIGAVLVEPTCVLKVLRVAGMARLTRSGAAWQTYGARWATLLALVQVLCPARSVPYGACQSFSMHCKCHEHTRGVFAACLTCRAHYSERPSSYPQLKLHTQASGMALATPHAWPCRYGQTLAQAPRMPATACAPSARHRSSSTSTCHSRCGRALLLSLTGNQPSAVCSVQCAGHAMTEGCAGFCKSSWWCK